MHASTYLPWLLIGPILAAGLGRIAFGLTGWTPLDYLWKAAVLLALAVIAAAFVANFRHRVRIERQDAPPPDQGDRG